MNILEKYKNDIERLKAVNFDRTIHHVHETDIGNFQTLRDTLRDLKINNLYVEVGAELTQKMITARFADEYHIYAASENYRDNPWVQCLLSQTLAHSIEKCGDDFLIKIKAK